MENNHQHEKKMKPLTGSVTFQEIKIYIESSIHTLKTKSIN